MAARITLVSHIEKVAREIDKAAEARVFEAVNLVRHRVLEKLSGTRSGRRYRVPGTTQWYTASAPGEAPAVATGALRQSIQVQVVRRDDGIVGAVGSRLDTSVYLETGTRTMAPRPFLGPAFEESRPEIERILSEEWFSCR